MLKFKVLNGYHAGPKAGHAVKEYDTTVEQDVQAASAEFDRLVAEGRTAISDERVVTKLPEAGEVTFLLKMAGG